MEQPTSVEPQPRIDTLVVDAMTGGQRRRTEYTGTAWYGSRPDIDGLVMVTRTGASRLEQPFFLPDSLPYRSDMAASALVACSVAIQSAADETHQLVDYRAFLAPDPRNPAVSWLQLQLRAFTRTPIAVSYRVDVVAPPEAVGPAAAATG